MEERKLVKNSLGYDSNLYVYQDKDMFNYSVDTILLGNFLTLNRKVKKILEIGTNNGALSIFISERDNDLKIDAVEIQEKAIEIAKMNIELNKKENNINLILKDFKLFYKEMMKQQKKYDAIVCNPPFYKVGSSVKRGTSIEMQIATHEIEITLEEIIQGASKIIQSGGYLSMVLPTERIFECTMYMQKYGFMPKRTQFIYPREEVKSNLVLIESRFNSSGEPHFLPNIYLHVDDKNKHEYREEVKELYKPIKVQK